MVREPSVVALDPPLSPRVHTYQYPRRPLPLLIVVSVRHPRPGPAGARLVAARLPGEPGVYRFRDEQGRALYVGRAEHLRRRVTSYWGELRGRAHLRRMVARIATVEAAVCESAHEAAWLERNLLERSKPPYNRTRGGQEVAVHIRLQRRRGAASLDLVHEGEVAPGQLFGPYLGGARVGLAISALHRVLPLAYAGERLAGSERDLARVLGVAATDLGPLVAAVTAVLARDPDAVASARAAVLQRRDAATAALAFELAARLHAEAEALEWVVASQRVTLPDPVDLDVYGWACGVLVHFEMRGGRLNGWRQRPCDEAAARPLVDATPPAWASFARRNAELAAHLGC
jgi:excinuclease ABC subunit C